MTETTEGMGDMISKALSDPRFAEIFAALKSKADSGELDASAISGMLGGVDPSQSGGEKEEAADGIRGEAAVTDGAEPSGSIPVTPKATDIVSLLSPLVSGASKGKGRETEKHTALLTALKPYLTDNKRSAVDNILKAAQLGDILEAFYNTKKGNET